MSRMTRKQAAAIAAAARKLPDGVVIDRSTVHLSIDLLNVWRKLTPIERGNLIARGMTNESTKND
jgi:hypothetical protein